jgi:hypothetical protein
VAQERAARGGEEEGAQPPEGPGRGLAPLGPQGLAQVEGQGPLARLAPAAQRPHGEARERGQGVEPPHGQGAGRVGRERAHLVRMSLPARVTRSV